MSVVVPQSVMEAVEEAAKRRRLSVPEFVEKALAAQSTAVLSDPYLEARAKRKDSRAERTEAQRRWPKASRSP